MSLTIFFLLQLSFSSPVALAGGVYWIGWIEGASEKGFGVKFNSVTNARAYNENSYAEGPTSTFGAASKDDEQVSIYAAFQPLSPRITHQALA